MEESGSVGAGPECDLHMHVHEDTDYDIEEIRFWNFISSKSKNAPGSLHQSKSNHIVRTLVYKVPESTYVVKQVPVYLEPDARSKESLREKAKETETKMTQSNVS